MPEELIRALDVRRGWSNMLPAWPWPCSICEQEGTMRIGVVILLLLSATVVAQSNASNAAGELHLTYLGQAGYEITDGKTVVLVDPVISMIKMRRDTKPGGLDMTLHPLSLLGFIGLDSDAVP